MKLFFLSLVIFFIKQGQIINPQFYNQNILRHHMYERGEEQHQPLGEMFDYFSIPREVQAPSQTFHYFDKDNQQYKIAISHNQNPYKKIFQNIFQNRNNTMDRTSPYYKQVYDNHIEFFSTDLNHLNQLNY